MAKRTSIKSLPILCVAGVLGAAFGAKGAAAAVPAGPAIDAGGPSAGARAEALLMPEPAARPQETRILVAGGFGHGFGGHSSGHSSHGFGFRFGGFGADDGVYAPSYAYPPRYTYEEETVSPAAPPRKAKAKRHATAASGKPAVRRKVATKPAPALTRSIAVPPPVADIDPPTVGAVPVVSRGGGGAPAPLGDATGGGRATFRAASPSTPGGLGANTGGGRVTPSFRAGPGRGR